MNNYIRIALRNLTRKPIYTIITFAGFTFSIAVSLLIYLWVYNELSYEKFHPDYQRIYRVLTLSKQGDKIVKSPYCYRPVPRTMKMDYPQIEYATYISYESEDSPLHIEPGGEKIEARMCWTNEDFFKIFGGFRFLEGSPESAFEKPDNIVLSEKTAKKIFGNQPALGKVLISDKYSKEVYTVGGVIRIPELSHIDFGFMLSEKNSKYSLYSENWSDNNWVRVYIKLKKDAKIDDQFLTAISNHISRYSKFTDKLMFQPLDDIHLHTDYETYDQDKNISSYKYVWIFSGLAFLIILMASVNFSALSVARTSERSVEIGIRKVNGGSRISIFRQFLSESVFQTFAATVVALFVVWFILPWFNTLSSKQLTFNISPGLITNLFLLTFLVGIIAGIYPSLYLSSFNPIGVFRSGSISGSKSNFIRVLVTVQFTIAIFFIIATLIFIKQLNYIHNKDLGIDDKNVVVIPTGLWYDNKEFKQELLKNPRIISVSASVSAPVDLAWKYLLPLKHQGRIDSLETSLFWVDEDFAKTYKLEVTKGQFLQMDYSAYWKEWEKENKSWKEGNDYTVSIPMVINQTAEKVLGFDDPVGQRIGNNIIVGVVKDFHFRPLYYPIGPLIMTNDPENIMTMNVRIAPGNISETLNYIRNTYRKNRDNREFSYNFFEDLLDKKYLAETRLKNITVAFALLAIVISVLGILGMATFSIDRRTKEIGIRRVAGAKSSEILILLNKEFITWVLVAFIIASPVAWYTMYKWLQNFVYKTGLSWWIFAVAGIIALGIALLTVSWQSWRAATRNPVEALRYE
ncbi:MAG: FtsX-like permease family protein [Bacteroidia bacterium]|nr:FtsX-like permease family protein [Bacteroidia bacterium]